jgi:DNA-binding NarL/FixJ family response regulator
MDKDYLKIKIMLVEDHPDFRESLSYLLNSNDQFICRPYASVEDAINDIRVFQPDLMLMDINLNGMSGIEGTAIIKEKFPGIQIMMCTVYEDDNKIFQALKAGASGYLLKRASIDEIFKSIMELYNGGSPMSSSIARRVVASFSKKGEGGASSELLSDRENQILELLAKGYRVKEIADQLYVSFNTVRTHIRNIYEKLQVSSRIEAVNKVRKNLN